MNRRARFSRRILCVVELTNAATKIQASFRGHLTRKNQKGNDQEALTKELKRLDTKVSEPPS